MGVIFEALAVAFVFLVGVCLASFGLLAFGAALQRPWAWLCALRSAHWPTTTGTVTRSVLASSTQRRTRYFGAGLVYAYQVNGQRFCGTRESFAEDEFEDQAEAMRVVARYAKGSSVTVHFHPQRPELAVLDVRRPRPLGFVAFPLSIGACVFLAGGIAILKPLFLEPLNFPTAGLPSLERQIAWLLLGLALICAFVALVRGIAHRARRALARRIEAAPLTAIAALRDGQLVTITGRAARGPGEFGESPVTDVPLVYERLRVLTGGGAERLAHVSEAAVRLTDDTGDILVFTESAVCEILPTTLPLEQRVTDWVDQSLETAHVAIRVEQQALVAGGPMLATGVVARDPVTRELQLRAHGYDRDDPGDPDPGQPGSLLLSDESREALLRRLARGRTLTRLLWIATIPLLIATVILLR